MVRFALFLLVLSFSAWAEKNICYFSLNNPKEYLEMKKLTARLNQVSKEKISIHEYQTVGTSPEESFQKMVTSGVKCDGLVISGHHTGAFSGKRGGGSLDIAFLEKLSCKPEYQQWFSGISAVWLQGCRTLGMKIEANSSDETQSSDFQTNRVGNVLEEDSIEASFAQLNMEFSSTLDQENPLSSRYLRVFPRSTVFGWTKTAPGEDAHSEFSIPYHIAHIARLNDDRPDLFKDPTKEISPEVAVKYAAAVNGILGRLDPKNKSCNEQLLIDGWLEHGQASEKKYPYSFHNPDLMAFASLDTSHDQVLKKARELDCVLKKKLSRPELLATVDAILLNETTLGYSFNAIWELLQRESAAGNIESLKLLKDKLRASPVLKHFIMQKLANKELGILRKIDYYSFYTDLTGETNPNIEGLIRSAATKIFLQPNPKKNLDLRDFKQTLIKSLVKNELIDKDYLKQFMDGAKEDEFLIVAIDGLSEVSMSSKERSQIYKDLLARPSCGQGSNLAIIQSLSDDSADDAEGILNRILDGGKTNKDVLANAAMRINGIQKDNIQMEHPEEILKKILADPKAQDDQVLSDVVSALNSGAKPMKDTQLILEKVQSSPHAQSSTDKALVTLIANGRIAVPQASVVFKRTIAAAETGDDDLYEVAVAMSSSKSSVKGTPALIDQILTHPKVGPRAIAGVIDLLYAENFNEPERKRVQKVLLTKYPSAANTMVISKELNQAKPSYELLRSMKQTPGNDEELYMVRTIEQKQKITPQDLEFLSYLKQHGKSQNAQYVAKNLLEDIKSQGEKDHPSVSPASETPGN